MIEPQPAATVMIVRDRAPGLEVFVVRRSSRSAFMPDTFVFPGGRVDPGDGAAAPTLLRGPNRAEPAHVFAAARETFEEAGLLLGADVTDARRAAAMRAEMLAGRIAFTELLRDLEIVLDAAAFHYFSRWITPPGETRRFDTRFFIAREPAGQIASADAMETHDGRWIAPGAALAAATAGTLALSFPTIAHLERLGAFTCVDAALAYAANKAIRTVKPDPAGPAFAIPSALEGVW